MRLYHYSREKLNFDSEFSYPSLLFPSFLCGIAKPAGFWVSPDVKEDWPAFANTTEAMHKRFKPRFRYKTRIHLRDGHNVLIIRNNRQFLELEEKFTDRVEGPFTRFLNIEKLRKQYDGLIITKYFWEFRMTSDWYYTWDCASGCIWNLDVIKAGRSIRYAL